LLAAKVSVMVGWSISPAMLSKYFSGKVNMQRDVYQALLHLLEPYLRPRKKRSIIKSFLKLFSKNNGAK